MILYSFTECSRSYLNSCHKSATVSWGRNNNISLVQVFGDVSLCLGTFAISEGRANSVRDNTTRAAVLAI